MHDDYIEEYIIAPLRQCTEGEIPQENTNWYDIQQSVYKCQRWGCMPLLHTKMQPYYEMYFFADRLLFRSRQHQAHFFIEELAKRDDEFIKWAEKQNLVSASESWADYLRMQDMSINLYFRFLNVLLERGYETNWEAIANEMTDNLFQAEVNCDYKTGEVYCILHAVSMIMKTDWLLFQKQEALNMLYNTWDFMKFFYSVMIRRIVGCRYTNFLAVANHMVAQHPEFHQYIHIFFCALSDRLQSLGLNDKQYLKLEDKLEQIRGVMNTTTPSEELNDLCDTLFPEEFQRLLYTYRPESYEQVERERNKLRLEVGLLEDQVAKMIKQLQKSVEASVPFSYIKEQLLRLPPGMALDIWAQLNHILKDHQGWKANAAEIHDSLLNKMQEQDHQMVEMIQTMSNQPKNLFKVYSQPGSTVNAGCELKNPEFKLLQNE